jgi:hypothetical protein
MNKLMKMTAILGLALFATSANASIMKRELNCGQFKMNGAKDNNEIGFYSVIIEQQVGGDILNVKIKFSPSPKISNLEELSPIGNGHDILGNYTLQQESTGTRVTIQKKKNKATLTLANGAEAICK